MPDAIPLKLPANAAAIDGRSFPSKAEAARAYGKDPRLILKRLALGWGIEDALTKPTDDKSVIVKGQTFRSVSDAAKAFGMIPNTIHRRVLRGASLEEALLGAIDDKA